MAASVAPLRRLLPLRVVSSSGAAERHSPHTPLHWERPQTGRQRRSLAQQAVRRPRRHPGSTRPGTTPTRGAQWPRLAAVCR